MHFEGKISCYKFLKINQISKNLPMKQTFQETFRRVALLNIFQTIALEERN